MFLNVIFYFLFGQFSLYSVIFLLEDYMFLITK